MFDSKIGDQYRGVFDRVNVRIVVCCLLISGAMLQWTPYVHAEEFTSLPIGETANVNIRADSQPLPVQNLESPAVVDANDKAPVAIDTDPDLSDVVQLDASNGDQHSQLDLAGSRDIQSLDVVDTASSVKLPRVADELAGGIDHQKVNVGLEGQPMAVTNDMTSEGGRLEAESNDATEQADQPLALVTGAHLPVTNSTADTHEQAIDAGNQIEDTSNDVAGEESAGLPYAVVLALLALIGLVPVARRNDQHHV